MESDRVVHAFTDGACLGNPGPGGWAVLLRWGARERLLSGAEPSTTNNRMELVAAIEALAALQRRAPVRLSTDSQYVQRGVTEWLPRWKRNGWRTSGGQPVANQDLWQRLDALTAGHAVAWEWVRGHSGHPENERVDRAARAAAERVRDDVRN
ncbi:MAG: ribonuclease HI [Pseudomonadota bacterium]|jgi:ribonuclease HI